MIDPTISQLEYRLKLSCKFVDLLITNLDICFVTICVKHRAYLDSIQHAKQHVFI